MKLLCKFFAMAFIASLFVSCGGDDPVDYTLKDLSVVGGTYTGACVVTNTNSNNTQTVNATVRLIGNGTVSTMILETDESGISTQHRDVLSNFKNTPDETAYTFDIKGFNFTIANVPYINVWFPSPAWSEISNVTITVSPSNDARYNKSNKTLTFSYTGSAAFTAKPQNGSTSQQTIGLKYNYTVVKQ
jgi:hypothetical protein